MLKEFAFWIAKKIFSPFTLAAWGLGVAKSTVVWAFKLSPLFLLSLGALGYYLYKRWFPTRMDPLLSIKVDQSLKDQLQSKLKDQPVKNVAVIGGGIAGTSFSYFLKEYLGDNVKIKLFEKEKDLGGRTGTVEIRKETCQSGAGVYHASNLYMEAFVKKFELAKHPLSHRVKDESVGIWDGDHFLVRFSKRFGVRLMQVLARYKLAGYYLHRKFLRTMKDFLKIYDKQKDFESFETVDDLCDALHLDHLKDTSISNFLKSKQIQGPVVDELVTCLTRVNYCQSADIGAIGGISSIASIERDHLYELEGGNDQIPKVLGNLCVDEQSLETTVEKVEFDEKEKQYQVSFTKESEKEKDKISTESFDAVVIALPISLTTIKLPVSAQQSFCQTPKFINLHIATVVGKLNAKYFGVSSREQIPSTIITPKKEQAPFISLQLMKTKEKQNAGLDFVHIFSHDRMKDEQLKEIFEDIHDIHMTEKMSYPVLEPKKGEWPAMKSDDLYYINAFESVCCSLETEAIAAKNVSILVAKSLTNYVTSN